MNEMTVKRKLKRPEILAPAGTLEKLKTAIHYGADAVYIGGNAYGLRSRAGNFTYEEMAEGVAFAKEHDAKVYVAANMVTHEGNEEGAGEFFRSLRDVGISAVIVSDPALIEICATEAPGLPIHLSTQASATNFETLEFWKEEGLERVVLAREVSMEEVGYRNRSIYSWSHVYFLFWSLHIVQPYVNARCESWRMLSILSLEIWIVRYAFWSRTK